MNTAFRTLVGIVTVAALALVAIPNTAQAAPGDFTGAHSAGWKQGVDTYWPARSASRSIENARGYAQDFQNYVVKMPNPEPSVVKDVKVELVRYLEEGKKHLATMKEDFAADTETVAAIATIEKELAAAIENHTKMIECCENETFDKIATMACCTDMVKQLDKIHTSHQNLMKKLAAKTAKTAKATKTTKPAAK